MQTGQASYIGAVVVRPSPAKARYDVAGSRERRLQRTIVPRSDRSDRDGLRPRGEASIRRDDTELSWSLPDLFGRFADGRSMVVGGEAQETRDQDPTAG